MFVQISIKQGISEQALSKGLNTDNTTNKYTEHKDVIKRCQPKQIYLPYFLVLRNIRETKKKKTRIFNSFLSEAMIIKKLIKLSKINITMDRSTTKLNLFRLLLLEQFQKK